MKTCPNCLSEAPEAGKFCAHCGASLAGVAAVPHELQMREEATVRLGAAFPFRAWLADRPWGIRWVKWFLFFGLFPLLCYTFFREIQAFDDSKGALELVALFIGAYFALFWAFVLRLCMSPEKTEKFLLTKVILFTAILGIFLVLLIQQWPLFRNLYKSLDSQSLGTRIFGFTLGVGFLEEAAKALPIFWFVFRKHRQTTPATFAYFGVMSGLAFGVAEASDYSVRYAVSNVQGGLDYSSYMTIQVVRFVSLPLLHAAWTGLVCYFMGLAAMYPRIEWRLIGLGMLTSMILHGLYDAFDGWLTFLMAGLSLILFIAYLRTKPEVWKELEKEEKGAPKQIPTPTSGNG